ncbi:MAG: glycosyltransferase family 2 protein [Candidatus Omnitrophica bacterium]|nr:glycosyltransferase family 2 protein [Candidatus Omnitrophota bacterium]
MQFDANKRCDIVIPVWNNPELTRDCVNSIIKHTRYPYRIVIIDDASEAYTRQYLDTLKKDTGGKTNVIRNAKNQGFVKSVNRGMEHSDAPYVCIMNNDTIATNGWLGEAICILRENPNIGLINPSSNTSCQFPGKLSIDAYAETLKVFKGSYQELYTCRAFAMIVKREVIKKIGYLDEQYGMGYFDDTDYCKHAQKLGYMTVRSKASYVYHKESQSFSLVKEKSNIFLENEKKFVSKWGMPLRIAYALPSPGTQKDRDRISAHINRMAKIGHQVWIFTTRRVKSKLDLIDHESIRFYFYPPFLFDATAIYKIWKRKKKKKMHVILTNCSRLYKFLDFFKGALGAEIFADDNLSPVEKKLAELSHAPF